MKINTGIPDNHLQEVAVKLNKLLANELFLSMKTRNYHWNVEAPNFFELHKFFESQYNELDEIMDDVAERIRALGHHAEGSIKDLSLLTDLTEQPGTSDPKEQIQNLLNDQDTITQQLRHLITEFGETHKDLGSADFVTGLLRTHEKMAWMLRSFLK